MLPASRAQYDATVSGQLPPLETVADGIWAFAQPYTGLTTSYTLSYLIRDSDDNVHIIDPGVDSAVNWARLESALRKIGGEIASITVTHMHDDHFGMVPRVAQITGAPVAIHREDQAALHLGGSSFRADVLLEDGMRLAIPGREIRVIHTPGHTPGSICLHDLQSRVVFTGDHLLPHQFPGIGPATPRTSNPVLDYLASLELIASLGDVEALPGHEYRFTGVPQRCEDTAAHHRKRTAEVAAILDRHPHASVETVAQQLSWSAGWPGLSERSRKSAIRQTRMHMEIARPLSEPSAWDR